MRHAILFAAPLLINVAYGQCPGSPANVVAWDNANSFASDATPSDEGLSNPPIVLPFAFPMPGAVGTLDRMWVHSNGEIYLTDSSVPEPVGGVSYGISNDGDMQGAPGASARIAVMSEDQDASQVSGAQWSITVDLSIAGEVHVQWRDESRSGFASDRYSFHCVLSSTGLIRFDYDPSVPVPGWMRYVGVSIGNGVATTNGSQDLTTMPSSAATEGIVFEAFDSTTWDLSGKSVVINPNFTPGVMNYSVIGVLPYTPPACAANDVYGAGCYGLPRESFYQYFANAAVASAALQGNSMTLDPAPNGYLATWNAGGAAAYVPPVAWSDFVRSDDDQDLLDLSAQGLDDLPVPGGSATTLYVHSNGYISTGPDNNAATWNTPPNNFKPSPSFRNAPDTAFWSWHNFDPSNQNGGPVRWHHDGVTDVLYITWDGVESWSNLAPPHQSTIQFQFSLSGASSPGRVVIVWQTVDTDTTSFAGSAYLVGYSPGGVSLDPGSINLATTLPLVTDSDLRPLTLTAAPRPVINPSTLVTYTASDIPEFVPGSGVYVSTMMLSLNPLPGGFDVAGILTHTPGCRAYLSSLDLVLGVQVTQSPTASWNLTFANTNFAPGNVVAAQAVSLFDGTFPLVNGENGGFVISNGVRSTTQLH